MGLWEVVEALVLQTHSQQIFMKYRFYVMNKRIGIIFCCVFTLIVSI